MPYVLCGAIDPLLVNEVQVIQGWLSVREHLEKNSFGHDLQGSSDRVVSGVTDVARPEFPEFVIAYLE